MSEEPRSEAWGVQGPARRGKPICLEDKVAKSCKKSQPWDERSFLSEAITAKSWRREPPKAGLFFWRLSASFLAAFLKFFR